MRTKSTRKFVAPLLATLCLMSILPVRAAAWGAGGHRIVARIAMDRLSRLSPSAAEKVRQVLAGNSVDFAAVWADTLRSDPTRKRSLNWHFADIPINTPGYLASRDCKLKARDTCTVGANSRCGDCIIAALERNKATLRPLHGGSKSREEQEALMFLIHFIGDLTQPLHCAADHDAGGNGKPVCFFGECFDKRGKNNNLHQTWDKFMIIHNQLINRFDEDGYVKRLEDKIAALPASEVAAFEQGTLIQWAEDSQKAAIEHSYARLPRRVRKFNPIQKKSFLYLLIDKPYYEGNIETVDRRLIAGGIRLAKVLRDLFE